MSFGRRPDESRFFLSGAGSYNRSDKQEPAAKSGPGKRQHLPHTRDGELRVGQ
jgi:hypothetical protein